MFNISLVIYYCWIQTEIACHFVLRNLCFCFVNGGFIIWENNSIRMCQVKIFIAGIFLSLLKQIAQAFIFKYIGKRITFILYLWNGATFCVQRNLFSILTLVLPPPRDFSLLPQNQKESDKGYLGNLNYIICKMGGVSYDDVYGVVTAT